MLQEQLAAEQESSTALVDQVDELKRKTEKTERELEKCKKRQLEEYNNLHELCKRFSSSDNSQSLLLRLDAVNICGLMCGLMCRFDVWTRMPI